MKKNVNLFAAGLLMASAVSALAEGHYVDMNSTNATPPYSSWSTAATNIQDAVDAAVAGDEIVVTNGIYVTGGRVLNDPFGNNRVIVDKPLTIRSVNGPQSTTIDGTRSHRCVYLTNGASLSGFTLTRGFARIGGGAYGGTLHNCILTGNKTTFGPVYYDAYGGGAAYSTLNNCTLAGNSVVAYGQAFGGGAYRCTLNNCTLERNSFGTVGQGFGGGAAYSTLNNCTLDRNSFGTVGQAFGGGAWSCALNNCTLTGNSAHFGGGVYISTLSNCTLSGNSAGSGGGASGSTLDNCIVYDNTGDNYYYGTLNYCCTTPQPSNGIGNITNAPLFMDQTTGNLRLQSNSPCINAGNNAYVTNATDLDGNPRIVGGTVDMGAYEFQAVRYVDVNSTNATPPYISWATAATNIQDAVDAAVTGDEIVVTNGIYANGGRAAGGGNATNRLAVDKPLHLRSVNGPQFTTIDGGRSNRCVYLTNLASLSGFTLTNGRATQGGGLWCESTTAVVSNCIVSRNVARQVPFGTAVGGGAYGGTLNNCTLTDNRAIPANSILGGNSAGGGAYGCTLNNCTLTGNWATAGGESDPSLSFAARGGGASRCTLNNCTLRSNLAASITWNYSQGGGAYGCTLNNCTLSDNSAYNADNDADSDTVGGGAYDSALNNCTLTGNSAVSGGGAYNSSLNNCTLTGNSAVYGGGASGATLNNCALSGNSAIYSGGGAYDNSTLNNCIVYFNTAPQWANYADSQFTALNHCCTTPQPTYGVGNITNAPLFVDQAFGNLRLQSNSPCINAGNNSNVTNATDLDGNPPIAGGTVDIGAYEFQAPASTMSYAWLQQFNLPINSSTDTDDPDGDGVNNYREWLARSDPTNPFSFAPLLTLIPDGAKVILTWPTNAAGFTLQSTTNLASPSVWSTKSPAPVVIDGQNVVTNPVTGAQQFFRLSQ